SGSRSSEKTAARRFWSDTSWSDEWRSQIPSERARHWTAAGAGRRPVPATFIIRRFYARRRDTHFPHRRKERLGNDGPGLAVQPPFVRQDPVPDRPRRRRLPPDRGGQERGFSRDMGRGGARDPGVLAH